MRLFKKILLVCAPLMLLIALLARGEPVQAADDTFNLVLHKRLYTDVYAKDQAWYQNDGQRAASDAQIMTATTGLNGVTFSVYDASALYQAAHQRGQDTQTFVRQYAAMNADAALAEAKQDNLTEVATATTTHDSALGEDGIAQLQLPRTQNGLPAVYLVVESGTTGTDVAVDTQRDTAPIVLSASMVDAAGAKLTTVHMYPKNLVYARDVYFFKYGLTYDGSEVRLPGAKFVLFRRSTDGSKQYLAAKQPDPLRLRWTTSTNPGSDVDVGKFTSQASGLVTLNGLTLPAGNYEFAEVASAEGYENDAGAIKVTVPDRMYTSAGALVPVVVNDTKLAATNSGQVTQAAIIKGEPRVYNSEELPPLPNTFEPPTPGGNTPSHPKTPNTPTKPGSTTEHPLLPNTGLFPQLGDVGNWILSSLGFVVMLLVIHFWKKRETTRA